VKPQLQRGARLVVTGEVKVVARIATRRWLWGWRDSRADTPAKSCTAAIVGQCPAA